MRRDDLCHAVRQRLERLPEPHDAHYGVVPAAPPEYGLGLGATVVRHQRGVAALGQVSALAKQIGDPYVVSRLLARREAISSSSIEGTNSTLDELLSLEEAAGDDQRDAARQVRDYAVILDRLVPRAAQEGHAIFTTELIADLHRAAMRSDPTYPDPPGVLRDGIVWMSGVRDIAYSTYNPTPPTRIADCLADTVAYLRGDGMQMMTQSLIARMAISHAHFEAVHPFRDGNGRVGRLLLPLMMAAEGHIPLYLSPYIEAHKQAYYDALKAAQQQLDWVEATAFMADAIAGTVNELLVTRDALSRLTAAWRTRRRFREKSAAQRALALLPEYPVFTAKRLAERLNVSAPAVGTAIDQLMAAGIVEERTGYSRNRIFAAGEVLRILNRPFGAPPIIEDRPADHPRAT